MDVSNIAEHLDLDTNLFGFNVSQFKVEKLSHCDLESSLKQLEKQGEKLVYWWSDSEDLDSQLAANSFCGLKVSEKLKYICHPSDISEEILNNGVKNVIGVDIVNYGPNTLPEEAFLALSPALAEGSRFKADPKIDDNLVNQMFDMWIQNSFRSVVKADGDDNNSRTAEHIIVAKDTNNDDIVGFITVCRNKLDPLQARLSLLAVSSTHRKQGIAKALVASAMLWAHNQRGAASISTLDMVMNFDSAAIHILDRFGFRLADRGTMWHFWLPSGGDDATVLADETFLPNNKPFLIGTELENIKMTLNSKNISSAGVFTKKCHAWLESIMSRPGVSRSRQHQTYKALLVGSGTQALEMSALLLNVKEGDEIIMPSYTFVSTANSFVIHGGIPVFVDCRPDTMNIDETKIEDAITEKTKMIVVVHYAGIACEMDIIMDIARRHNLIVVEDAAHAILSYYKGQALGSIGDYGCFSFHYTKNLIAGECGAIAINRPEHVSKAMIVWEKGTNRYDFLNGKVDKYAWVGKGSSFLPSEITASILWAQFESAYAIQNARTWAWHAYHEAFTPLADAGLIQIPALPEGTSANGHIYWVVFRTIQEKCHVDNELKKHGIQAFSHYVPLHNAAGGKKYGRTHGIMSVTESMANRLLRMPIWPEITIAHIRRIQLVLCEVFRKEKVCISE